MTTVRDMVEAGARGRRPDFVRRHVRHAWIALAVVAPLAALFAASDADASGPIEIDAGSTDRVTATVGPHYRGGAPIPVSFDHPTFGAVHTDLETSSLDLDVEPGDRLDVYADELDPQDVVVAGDDIPRDSIWWFVVPPVVVLVWALGRSRRARLTEHMAASPGEGEPYLGRIRRRTPPSRRVALNIYPVGAPIRSKPVCSVPLLSTGGLPLAGPAFPVQVRTRSWLSSSTAARPKPFRWVSVTTDREVLWPSRRALGPRHASAVTELPDEADRAPFPPNPETTALGIGIGQPRPPRLGVAAYVVPLAVLAVGLAIAVVTTVVTTIGDNDAHDRARSGIRVPAEIVDVDSVEYRVTITYRAPGQERRAQARAPVSYPDEWDEGDKALAAVDPDDPGRAVLLADLYDAFTPLFVGWLMVVPGIVWVGRRLQIALRMRRWRSEPWCPMRVTGGARRSWPPIGSSYELVLQREGAAAPSCRVLITGPEAAGFAEQLRTAPLPATPVEPPAPFVPPPSPVTSPFDFDSPPADANSPPTPPAAPPPAAPAPPPAPPAWYPPWAVPAYEGEVLVSGIAAPGETVVLRRGDVVVPTYRPARLPKPGRRPAPTSPFPA